MNKEEFVAVRIGEICVDSEPGLFNLYLYCIRHECYDDLLEVVRLFESREIHAMVKAVIDELNVSRYRWDVEYTK